MDISVSTSHVIPFPQDVHVVDLTESTIEANKRFFASADDVPKQAYTMGVGTILRAKAILLVVSGKDKAEALNAVVNGPITPQVSWLCFKTPS